MRHYSTRFGLAVLLLAAIALPLNAQTTGPGPGTGGAGLNTIVGYGEQPFTVWEHSPLAQLQAELEALDDAEQQLAAVTAIATTLGATVQIVSQGITYSDGRYIPGGGGQGGSGTFIWEADYTITFRVIFPAPPGSTTPVPADDP